MKSMILAAVLLSSVSAQADTSRVMIAREGDDVIRLTDSPCTLQVVLQKAQEGTRGYLRAASATVGGQEFKACWVLTNRGMVFLGYDDGDAGEMPAEMFMSADEI